MMMTMMSRKELQSSLDFLFFLNPNVDSRLSTRRYIFFFLKPNTQDLTPNIGVR